MPTVRLPDCAPSGYALNPATCRHQDHHPSLAPSAARAPGRYQHTCARCGYTIQFTVPPEPVMYDYVNRLSLHPPAV